MHITDKYGRCSIEIKYNFDESSGYDSFSFHANVDIGHGLFSAKNEDVHFFDLPTFVAQLDAFILDQTIQPCLNGTYDSFLSLSGTPSSVNLRFCVADGFSGYKQVNTPFALTGAFDIEPDLLFSVLTHFREMLESWRSCRSV
ncbi:MAG: hypothetical protein M3R45_03575 [Pseudomonadota bacterium]|nr:hypothetical protein [Pseudomonadota bacterium]